MLLSKYFLEIKLAGTGCLFVGETKPFNRPAKIPEIVVIRVIPVTGWKSCNLHIALAVWAQLCDEKLLALLGMIKLKSWIRLSHFASCIARQVYATKKRKCFNSKVLCSSLETTISVIHTSSIAIRSLLSELHTYCATTSCSCRILSSCCANARYLNT